MIIDTERAVLAWEPKRVVPSYAVPVAELDRVVIPACGPDAPASAGAVPHLGHRPVHDPSVPFAVHTTDGETFDLCAAGGTRPAAAVRPADEALRGYLIVDFDAVDEWFEEDERNLAHPRDPFHRIEIVHSSRSIPRGAQRRTPGRVIAPVLAV